MKKVLPPDKSEELSLNEFIETNHKQISTIGIFTAITVFTTNLKLEFFSVLLSLLFLLITVIVWLELLDQFPESATGRLRWFKIFFSSAFYCFVGYCLVAYYLFWNAILPIVIVFLFIRIITVLINKFDLYRKFCYTKRGREKSLQYFLFWCVIFPFISYLGIKISFIISPSIGEFITQLSSAIK